MNSTREQRLQYIMEILKERHTVPLLELSDVFSVSTVTIRKDVAELEEKGRTLMDYVKETYRYQADRVAKALADITGKEDDDA